MTNESREATRRKNREQKGLGWNKRLTPCSGCGRNICRCKDIRRRQEIEAGGVQ